MDDLFRSTRLEVLVPEQRVHLDVLDTGSPRWWSNLSTMPQRKQAFFDERLYLLMCVKLPNEPDLLAAVLQRLQISLEASYINPFVPASQTTRPPTPGNAVSSAQLRPRGPAQVIPPTTPNPVPHTNTPDRQYAQADAGVILQTYFWGDSRPRPKVSLNKPSPGKDEFIIAWSAEENAWIALYELHVLVTFIQTKVSEPLLCLTTSATLRDTPMLAPASQALVISRLEGKGLSVASVTDADTENGEELEDILHGMEEVNLLDNLNEGTTFGTSLDRMSLSTARVGESIRQNAFSLPPKTPEPHDAKYSVDPMDAKPILRKSFRKTLRTVEGVHLRMKNCFVPYVPLSVDHTDDEDAAAEEESAGSEERIVILSVEIENAGSGLGFIVENVTITISGGLAHATLIGWGDSIHSNVFPLRLNGNDQYNLLYRVSFLTLPEGNDHAEAQRRLSTISAVSSHSASEAMRRYVAIDLSGHPFRFDDPEDVSSQEIHLETYSSRWNCLLDLVATQQADPPTFYNRPSSPLSANDVMPDPPSPFPSSKSFTPAAPPPPTPAAPWNIARSARNSTLPSTSAGQPSTASSLSPLANQTKFTPTSPSAVLAAMNAQAVASSGSPTPRSDRFPSLINPRSNTAVIAQHPPTPATPALPAYPAEVPATSDNSMGPVFQTPLNRGGYFDSDTRREVVGNMVVTVNLIPPAPTGNPEPSRNGNPIIYPHDIFTLEIFVLNLSSDVRRCEVAYPPQRRRDTKSQGTGVVHKEQGLMPLDNRIRVGPLLPGACQSVHMQVLALIPGVHMIDMLTLIDITTSYTVNMRSVMSVVVSEPEAQERIFHSW